MRKWIHALFVFALFLAVLAQPVSAASKTAKVKVTLVSVQLVENNHVGNEWLTAAYINGKQVQQGSSITLTLKSTDKITLKAYAEEQDKIPEDGTATVSIKASSVTQTISKSLTVEVIENRGRYSGNSAEWKFTFKIQK